MTWLLMQADARHIPLADGSVHCVVTSPPYWGLRDYGIPGQLGLEPTPEEYVANMVAVFREVKRVLRDDGTCWANWGDAYAGSWGNYGGGDRGAGKQRLIKHGSSAQNPVWDGLEGWRPPASFKQNGLKPKDLIGIPWRVAFALQADGWWLRSDIIWSKPNPMPESVTDRPTKSHEYLFLLAKRQKYFYDAEAIRLPPSGITGGACFGGPLKDEKAEQKIGNALRTHHRAATMEDRERYAKTGANARTVWTIPTQAFPEAHFATFPEALVEPCILAGTSEKGCCPRCGRPWERVVDMDYMTAGNGNNNRAVKGGTHDASISFRPAVRKLKTTTTLGFRPACGCYGEYQARNIDPLTGKEDGTRTVLVKSDLLAPVPCTVFDPFAGSGTTLAVAVRHGRRAVGCDLSGEYLAMAHARVGRAARPSTYRDMRPADAPLFAAGMEATR